MLGAKHARFGKACQKAWRSASIAPTLRPADTSAPPQAFRLAGGAGFPSTVLPFAGTAFFAAAFGLAAPGAFAAAGFRAGLAGLPSRSAISSIASCRVIASSAIDLGIVALILPQLT